MPDAAPPMLHVDDPAAVDRAAEVLLAGGAVVVPTDTVYGLAVLASVPGAVDQLFELKARAAGQPIAVLVSGTGQAAEIADLSTPAVARWSAALWPGALTIVVPRAAAIAGLDLGGAPGTVGVRCPDHRFLRALAERVGPLATTSANRSGGPTPPDAAEAAASLVGPVGLVVDGGPTGTMASTVVDATGPTWRVLREGAVSEQLLHEVAG